MKAEVKDKLEQEPRLWIIKLLSISFIFALMIWASNALTYNGVQESGYYSKKYSNGYSNAK